MTNSLLLKIVVFLAGIVSVSECEASCWPEVVNQLASVELAYDRSRYDAHRAPVERGILREGLRECADDTDLFYSLPEDRVMSGTYSILSMAIVADDSELTRKYADRLEQNRSHVPDDLMYGGEYVALAAFFESENALDELLRLGLSAVETSGDSWETPLYNARIFTEAGLRVVRRLVDAGADIHALNSRGGTEIGGAAWHGDLLKVQCLYSLGAALPLPTSTDNISFSRSIESIMKTNSFIRADDKELPKQVSEICNSASD